MLRSSFQLLLFAAITSTMAVRVTADEIGTDKDVQASALRMQARVAAEQGDFTKALKDIEQAARIQGDRATADQARKLAPEIQGGSQFWDPTELINLITQQTSPPALWVDVDGEGGTITPNSQGVFIAAPAVLKALSQIKDDSHLQDAVRFVRNANHNTNVRQAAKLRMVSLVRLEQHVASLLKAGKEIPADVANMAGLTDITYLLVYPETGDIVIAGPAADWTTSEGRSVSVTGRPTLQLDDLVTLSRAFGDAGDGYFMCTIDPKQDQVAAVQDYVNKHADKLTRRNAAEFTRQVEQGLGLQNVFVKGIPQDSRVASVIVDADYRMKEIGIGKRKGPEGMKSYFDLLTRSEQRGSGSMDALRWWMAVGYEAVNMSQSGHVFEFAGNPVQCLSEDQVVGPGGQRTGTGKATRANAKFADLFTRFLPELAAQDVVFADLENVFDLSMVAALVNAHGLANQVGWTPDAFVDGDTYPTRQLDVPAELMTAAQHRVYPGGSIVIQVAGGVRVDLDEYVNGRSKVGIDPELDTQSTKATPKGQQGGRWWWDAN